MVDALDTGHLVFAWRIFLRVRGEHDNGGNDSTHGLGKYGDTNDSSTQGVRARRDATSRFQCKWQLQSLRFHG